MIKSTVAIGVLMDGDLVLSAKRRTWQMRGGWWHAIVDNPPDLVATHLTNTGGIRILDVLYDPEPSALVEAEVERLLNDRLGESQIDLEIIGETER